MIVSCVAALAIDVGLGRFGDRWRGFLTNQLEQRGIHVEFDRLTLNPFGGLTAHEVQFFNDVGRQQPLASVNQLSLDFDYGELLKGRISLEGLALVNAEVSLPVDPLHPELTIIELKDFTARAFLRNRLLEIRQADGELAGIRLLIAGSLQLQPPPESEEERRLEMERAAERLKMVRQYREQIQQGLDWIKRFHFLRPPLLSVNVRGDTSSVEFIKSEMTLATGPFSYKSYECNDLRIEAAYERGRVTIKKMRLADNLGSFEASAFWSVEKNEVEFQIVSNADLPSVADALFTSDLLREIVFYDEGPSLSLEGKWSKPADGVMWWKGLRGTGRFHCGRFTSRGEVFEGLAANFAMAGNNYYLRDGLLRHRTGNLNLEFMSTEAEGMRYRLVLKMDPRAFTPFVSKENTREVIQRFGFQPESSIFVRLEGKSPQNEKGRMISRGRGEIRTLSHRGVPFLHVESDLEIHGPEKMIFRNVKAERQDGLAEADEVEVNDVEKWVRLRGVRSKCDPVPLLQALAPRVVEAIAKYRLPSDTLVNVDGVFGWRGPAHTDSHVGFEAAAGTGTYRLFGEDHLIESPGGRLHFLKDKLHLQLKGRIFGGPLTATGVVDLDRDDDEFDVTVSANPFKHTVFGKLLDFELMSATVNGSKGSIQFDVRSRLLDGEFSAVGSTSGDPQFPDYEGELKVNAASFSRFAQIYTPEYQTEGDLTGHLKFAGRLGDWKTLRGDGVAIIVNGNLYAVPILGPLTPLLGGFLPTPIKGYNIAREGNCTFTIQDGVVRTDDLEALTSAFRLVSKGTVHFMDDRVDFDAQARVRGLPGLVLRPVSELLEYRARGTVSDPKWRPRIFDLGSGLLPGESNSPTGERKGASTPRETEKPRQPLFSPSQSR